MTKYAELLRDPRWQKKRLEILARDEFTCKKCQDTDATLHVHHCYYENGKSPWEYENLSLLTLCESCHEQETKNLYNAKKLLLKAMSLKGFISEDYDRFAMGIYHFEIRCTNKDFSSSFSWAMEDRDIHDFIVIEYNNLSLTEELELEAFDGKVA